MRYAFIRTHEREFRVSAQCRALRVSRSGYYAWASRPESERGRENRLLLERIEQIHRDSREAYGAVKTWRFLQAQGVHCGKNRVARLRRCAGLITRRVRRFRRIVEHHQLAPAAPNRLEQCFSAPRADTVWVADTTFIPTRAGWLHLAAILDLHSRRVVGWSMDAQNSQRLTLAALEMALTHRAPGRGLIHHSDQGSCYAGTVYQARLARHGIRPSMSAKGNAYDNAVAESFFSTLKNELVHHRDFHTRDEARTEIFEFIELFYNRQRLHQTLGYVSPAQFEGDAVVA